MNRRARSITAAVALPIIAILAVVGLWPTLSGAQFDPSGSTTTAGVSEHHSGGAIEAGTDPSVSADGAAVGPVVVARGDETSPGSQPHSNLALVANDGVVETARDAASLGSPRAAVDPSSVIGAESLGGCAVEYGSTGQCLPIVPPSMADHVTDMVEIGVDVSTMSHDWQCLEVRLYFSDGLPVRSAGVDPQRLDANGDGIACGTGDPAFH